MKKIILVAVSITLLIIVYLVFSDTDPKRSDTPKEQDVNLVKQKKGLEGTSGELGSSSNNIQEAKDTTDKQKQVDKPNLSCYQRYSAKPEWVKIQKIQGEIYIDMSYLNSEGNSYTNMPVESLKSFADSGDVDAMVFYGVELMQTAALGLSTLKRAELERQNRMQDAIEKRKLHEPDLEQFREGVEYLHRAALEKKLAVFLEVELYYRALARQLHERSWSDLEVYDALSKSVAYKMLQKEILKENDLIVKMMSQNGALEHSLKRLYSDEKDIEGLAELIRQRSEVYFEDLKKDWVISRQSKGLEPSPKLIPKGLKDFAKAMVDDCYSD